MIDIEADNLNFHNIVLKSSKPDVKPLTLKIGNSLLSDTINCFDQLNESSKVRIKKSGFFISLPKRVSFGLNKVKFLNLFMPPLIAICSLALFSATFIYFYDPVDDKEKNEFINAK